MRWDLGGSGCGCGCGCSAARQGGRRAAASSAALAKAEGARFAGCLALRHWLRATAQVAGRRRGSEGEWGPLFGERGRAGVWPPPTPLHQSSSLRTQLGTMRNIGTSRPWGRRPRGRLTPVSPGKSRWRPQGNRAPISPGLSPIGHRRFQTHCPSSVCVSTLGLRGRGMTTGFPSARQIGGWYRGALHQESEAWLWAEKGPDDTPCLLPSTPPESVGGHWILPTPTYPHLPPPPSSPPFLGEGRSRWQPATE